MNPILDMLNSLKLRVLHGVYAQLRGHDRRITELENQMSAVTDLAAEFNAETNRLGKDITKVADKLQAAIDSGDMAAVAELRPSLDLLRSTADRLHVVASDPNNPVPPVEAAP